MDCGELGVDSLWTSLRTRGDVRKGLDDLAIHFLVAGDPWIQRHCVPDLFAYGGEIIGGEDVDLDL